MNSPFRYNGLSKEQRDIAKAADEFCLDKFCPRLKNRMIVRVIGKLGYLDRKLLYAECEYTDDSPEERYFRIHIDTDMGIYLFLETLMHEMVHVKQFAKGEMKDYIRTDNLVRWHKEKIDIFKTDYWDYPWEIEAHGRERGLVVQFKAKYPMWAEILEEYKE